MARLKPWRDPVHVQQVLQRERALASELFTPPTAEERAEIARRLSSRDRSLVDVLPDPQLGLPLQVAA